MKEYIEVRVLNIADQCIATKGTIRTLANMFSISKSTVHKDLTQRLKEKDETRYRKVKKILNANKKERSIRGGMSTKRKFEEMKKLSKRGE